MAAVVNTKPAIEGSWPRAIHASTSEKTSCSTDTQMSSFLRSKMSAMAPPTSDSNNSAPSWLKLTIDTTAADRVRS